MRILRFIDRIFPPHVVYAHCDVPCGIYKKDAMITAAETVARMVDKIVNPPAVDEKDKKSRMDFHNNMTRFVLVKEQHAELCKREVLILWTDFFKSDHLEKYPDLHDLVWKITKLCSDNKREVSIDKAGELVGEVKKLGSILEEAQGATK